MMVAAFCSVLLLLLLLQDEESEAMMSMIESVLGILYTLNTKQIAKPKQTANAATQTAVGWWWFRQ
jgi:4-hydroxybenzoate polyprenyltransferase